MCSPLNGIPFERCERTSAIDGPILILNNLFRSFNDIVTIKWRVLKTSVILIKVCR
jgi:hypothetical protein